MIQSISNESRARILAVLLTAVMVVFSAGCSGVQTQREAAPEKGEGLDFTHMDRSYEPGNDLFMYMNGTWYRDFEIPGEYTNYGAFTELREKNIEQVKTLMDSLTGIQNASEGSITQKIADFLAVAMDSAKAEALGVTPLSEMQAEIKAVQTREELMNLIFRMHIEGSDPMFGYFAWTDPDNADMMILHLGQGGLGLPERDYYLSEDPRNQDIRAKYREHIAKMLVLSGAGYTPVEAADAAERIFSLEHGLAEISMPITDRRDPQNTRNITDLDGLKGDYPNFPWDKMVKEFRIGYTDKINVRQTEFYAGLNGLLAEPELQDWKDYLQWNLINRTSPYLNNELVMADFDFYQKFLSGAEAIRPRWKRAQAMTSGYLGEAVGQLYVERYFPPEAKERMVELVENLRVALGERIDNLDWMSDVTKAEARKKLAAVNVKIGYPDRWKDYSELKVGRESYLENIAAGNRFYFFDSMNDIGKPTDKEEWGMTPQTVNAYYSPALNEVVFPAAILQPPFFNMEADDAVNYGAIGVVIGHEISHGFDDSGRQFDADGNIRDWWTGEDNERFSERAQVLIDQFSSYTVLDSIHVNGELTLGENIGDLGGLLISYDAMTHALEGRTDPRVDGLSYGQRFLLSYAQIWRVKYRDQALIRRVKEDPHSPGMFRANGAVRNFDPFYAEFNVNENMDLYLAPEDRARIW